jgi:hypothetical protein
MSGLRQQSTKRALLPHGHGSFGFHGGVGSLPVRRAVEDDKFPRAPRLDPLRSALAKLEPPPMAPPPARGKKRAS